MYTEFTPLGVWCRVDRICLLAGFLLCGLLSFPYLANCQDNKIVPNGTDGLTLTKAPDDSVSKKLPPNEFLGSKSSIKVGIGYAGDYATFSQSAVFKKQMDSAGLDLDPNFQTRDFRLMLSGVLKTKRSISWKMAYLYDGNEKIWMIRETGITIGVPELFGHIFIGRTKEGYSAEKVMNGHSILAQERPMAVDVVPILADGIKWFGYLPKTRIFWNLGYFNDFISKGQGFSTYKSQFSGRVGWLPYYDKQRNKVVHVGINLRYGKPADAKMTVKSRPESNPLPQIINTGSFKSDHSTHIGAEFYYSNSTLLIGSEVAMHNFQSKDFEDHKFYGGSFTLSYLFAGGMRPYNTVGNIFGFVKGSKSVFKGGWGAWEAVLRFSNLDLNDGSVHGGKFWRFTPMINWYMSRIVRTEFIYGYGVLDRYNLQGSIHLFQARLQLSIL